MTTTEYSWRNEKTGAFYPKGCNTGLETTPAMSHQSDIDITQRNATSSPLLQLPPEIRNMIYTLVLRQGTIEIFHDECDLLGKNVLSMGLLRVCRQVHAETHLLPYKLNEFVFWTDQSVCVIKTFLAKRTEAQIAVLRKVKIDNSRFRTALVWRERLRDYVCSASMGLPQPLEFDGHEGKILMACTHRL